MNRSEKHEKKFSKKIVVLSITTIIIYTATVLYFTWHGRFVPDSLTYAFYGVFGVELASLAGIRIKETVRDKYYNGGDNEWIG